MKAIFGQATPVAVEVDMLRESPFRYFLLPVYHERQITLKAAVSLRSVPFQHDHEYHRRIPVFPKSGHR
jgi:hypothetical protein